MCSLKNPGSNTTPTFSHQLLSIIFSSNWKGTPFTTGHIGISFSSEVHFWNVFLFNFYKVTGPQTLTNELHYTQGSTYLLWQSASLEEWYLHMRGKEKQNQIPILSLLVSVTLTRKSSQNFRLEGNEVLLKWGNRILVLRGQGPGPVQGQTRLPSFLVVVR